MKPFHRKTRRSCCPWMHQRVWAVSFRLCHDSSRMAKDRRHRHEQRYNGNDATVVVWLTHWRYCSGTRRLVVVAFFVSPGMLAIRPFRCGWVSKIMCILLVVLRSVMDRICFRSHHYHLYLCCRCQSDVREGEGFWCWLSLPLSYCWPSIPFPLRITCPIDSNPYFRHDASLLMEPLASKVSPGCTNYHHPYQTTCWTVLFVTRSTSYRRSTSYLLSTSNLHSYQ